LIGRVEKPLLFRLLGLSSNGFIGWFPLKNSRYEEVSGVFKIKKRFDPKVPTRSLLFNLICIQQIEEKKIFKLIKWSFFSKESYVI
jgi:hypothetical protein